MEHSNVQLNKNTNKKKIQFLHALDTHEIHENYKSND